MKRALVQLVEELKRLRESGVGTVAVSGETLDLLRERVAARAGRSSVAADTGKESTGSSSGRESPASLSPPPKSESPPSQLPEWGFDSSRPAPSGPVAPAPAFPIAEIPDPQPFSLPEGDKRARWESLRRLVLESEVCRAHVREGCQVVFGVGNLDADLFFVGEAPGADEEVRGEPFVGPAGQLLTRMIQGMGLERGDVYIGNIMNWRPEMPSPTGNRPPNAREMAFCLPFLLGQIRIVQPKVVIALGLTAATGLLGLEGKPAMKTLRGRWFEAGGIPCRVTYHPSYILRNGSIAAKRMVWEDLLTVMDHAGLPVSEKQRGYYLRK